MFQTGQTGQLMLRCDLCNIAVLWLPHSQTMSVRMALKAGWVDVEVMGERLAVCPTCQVIARALQEVNVPPVCPECKGMSLAGAPCPTCGYGYPGPEDEVEIIKDAARRAASLFSAVEQSLTRPGRTEANQSEAAAADEAKP